MSVVCRAIRGATTSRANTSEDILEATTEMLETIFALNDIEMDDVVSAFFTTTKDLTATFPAVAARGLGMDNVALMCAHEMDVPGSLTSCVRVMLQVNTAASPDEIKHVYLRDAIQLRPEWGREPQRRESQAQSVEATA
ncbi:MAG: chorismate mutase [Thermomicrobiales bacterium]